MQPDYWLNACQAALGGPVLGNKKPQAQSWAAYLVGRFVGAAITRSKIAASLATAMRFRRQLARAAQVACQRTINLHHTVTRHCERSQSRRDRGGHARRGAAGLGGMG